MIGEVKYYPYIGNRYRIRMGKALYGENFGEYGQVSKLPFQGHTVSNRDFLVCETLNIYAFSATLEDLWQ